jgi:ATP-dependent Clp protease ATP-binding subunit ClpA
MTYSDGVVDFIHAKAIKEKELGARPIIRLIQTYVEDNMTELILENEYDKGYTFKVECEEGKIAIS